MGLTQQLRGTLAQSTGNFFLHIDLHNDEISRVDIWLTLV